MRGSIIKYKHMKMRIIKMFTLRTNTQRAIDL
mgnify:CR=1 FL=1